MRKFLFLFLILITGCSEDRAIEKESKPLSSIKFYLHCTYNPQLISDELNARSNNSYDVYYNFNDIPDDYDYLLVFTTPDSEHKNENIELNELAEQVTRAEMDMSMTRIYRDYSDYLTILRNRIFHWSIAGRGGNCCISYRIFRS